MLQFSTAHILAGFTLSYSHTVTLSHPLLRPEVLVALIIAPNLEDGNRPNLLVPVSNRLILKDRAGDLLGLNDFSVALKEQASGHPQDSVQ